MLSLLRCAGVTGAQSIGSVKEISFLKGSFDLFVGHDVLQSDDRLAGCCEFFKVLRKGACAEYDVICAGSALAFRNGAVTQFTVLDVVFLHDLLDGILHHQGRTGAVGAAGEQLFVIEFSQLYTSEVLLIGP